MPIRVRKVIFFRELSLTDAVVNDGLNHKDLKVAKFIVH